MSFVAVHCSQEENVEYTYIWTEAKSVEISRRLLWSFSGNIIDVLASQSRSTVLRKKYKKITLEKVLKCHDNIFDERVI